MFFFFFLEIFSFLEIKTMRMFFFESFPLTNGLALLKTQKNNILTFFIYDPITGITSSFSLPKTEKFQVLRTFIYG